MSIDDSVRRALAPLWALTTGVAVGAVGARFSPVAPPEALAWVLLVAAAGCGAAALAWSPRAAGFVAGLLAAVAASVVWGDGARHLDRLLAEHPNLAVRVSATVRSGWTPTRFGVRTRVDVIDAHHADRRINLPRRCALEVRGADLLASELPRPGVTIRTLASVADRTGGPLLVVASSRLVEAVSPPAGVHALRQRAVDALLRAAGTDVHRVRAAELASALVVGRRDLVPRDRRDGWRRSGLAHLLAVSGLHVGLVGGIAWLVLTAAGARPRSTALVLLVLLPGYAWLAGAAPSATRAAAMAAVYLLARLVGRPIVPMAAVLIAVVGILLHRPGLVADVGFQLTVVVAAALVRWTPSLAHRIPGPRWLAAAIAVPVIAQAAAAPIIAWHFRTAVPGALVANLLVPPLLAPLLAASLVATGAAFVVPAVSAGLLDLVSWLQGLLWWCGQPGRSAELVLPALAATVAALFAATGWLALQHGRRGLVGALGWILLVVAGASRAAVGTSPPGSQVTLLPVSVGLSATISSGGSTVLVDGGALSRQAAELLATDRTRRIDALLVSHPDGDHAGGCAQVLTSFRVDRLLLPRWMATEPTAVDLLRRARRGGTRILHLGRGSGVSVGRLRVETLWPPARTSPVSDNDRALVARLRCDDGRILCPSDIDAAVETRLSLGGPLASEVLLLAHHGSRTSTAEVFLDACRPQVVLIPAGPDNSFGHPHPEVVARVAARKTPYRSPIVDGRCGARTVAGRWVAFP